MLRLYAEYAACRHDGVVDFRNAAVRTRQHEIVQHVLAASLKGAPDPDLAEARHEIVSDLGRGLAQDEGQEEGAADGEHEYRRADTGYPRGNGRFRRDRG